VKETTQPVIRERPPEEETPDAFRAIVGAQGTSNWLQTVQEQMKQLSEQRQQLMEQQQKWYEKLVKREPRPVEEILQEQFGKWAVPETFQQLQQITQLTLPLQQQLADLQTREQAEIERIEKQAIPQPVIDRQILETQNRYNKLRAPIAAQLQAYAAQMQALQGNLTTARQFAQMAVNAATYDEEQQYNRLRDFIEMNQTFIDSLTSDQRYLLNTALTLREQELDRARREKDFVISLMTDPDTAPAFQGIDINTLTAEDAAKIAQEYLAERPAEVEEVEIPTIKVKEPETGEEKAIDISTISGLEEFKKSGGTREDAKAFLDVNTNYSQDTINDMLDRVFGPEKPTSVAGMKQWLKQQLVDLSKRSGVFRKDAKQVIKENGFDPDDEEWQTFLDLFPVETVFGPTKKAWYKPWTWFK